TARVIPDDFEHELATCFNVKGRGLVVLTSCSHRGVVNSVKRAMEVSGIKKVHAVAGGFHLAPQKEDYVRETVAALKEISPDYVIPMHCTGEGIHRHSAKRNAEQVHPLLHREPLHFRRLEVPEPRARLAKAAFLLNCPGTACYARLPIFASLKKRLSVSR